MYKADNHERLTFYDNYEVPEPFDETMAMDESAEDIGVQWKLFPDKVLTSSESSLEDTSALDNIAVLPLMYNDDVNQAETGSNEGDDTLGEEENEETNVVGKNLATMKLQMT